MINIWKLGLDVHVHLTEPVLYLYNSLCIKLLELHRHKSGPSRTTNRCVEGQRYPIYNNINRGCKSCSRERRLGESASLELYYKRSPKIYTNARIYRINFVLVNFIVELCSSIVRMNCDIFMNYYYVWKREESLQASKNVSELVQNITILSLAIVNWVR